MKTSALVLSTLLLAVQAGAAPDAVYVNAHGVRKIDASGKVTQVVPKAELPNRLVIDSDGDLWVAHASGQIKAHKAQKRSVQLPGKIDADRYPGVMTAASGGGVWVTTEADLFRVTPKGKLEKHSKPVAGALGATAIIDTGSGLWLAREDGIHAFDGTAWKLLRPGRYKQFVRDSNGTVWAIQEDAKADRLVGFDGKNWIEVKAKKGILHIAAGQGGRIYALVSSTEGWQIDVVTASAGAATWTTIKLGGVDHLSEIAVDGSERIWAKQKESLIVLAKDGKQLASYEPGTVAGLDGLIDALVAVGNGPATLPTTRAVIRGVVKGRFVKPGRVPLANTKVKLCLLECEGPSFEVTTDAKGNFTAKDVAAIEYATLHIGEGAQKLSNFLSDRPRNGSRFECCVGVTATKPLDVGTITVVPKE